MITNKVLKARVFCDRYPVYLLDMMQFGPRNSGCETKYLPNAFKMRALSG